jgi:polyisoprenoid-binding protein YceI
MITNQLVKIFKSKSLGLFWITLLLFEAFTLFATQPLLGQQVYKIVPKGNSLLVKGDSNLHEWETKGDQVTGELTSVVDNGKFKKVDKVSVKITVNTLKSGKGVMDSKVYEALKNDKFPTITYQSDNITLPRTNEIVSIGQFTIAGVSKNKMLTGTYTIGTDGKITIKGSVKLKMTEFGMTLPTAFFGSLKVYDDVEVLYEVSFK